MSQPTQTPQGGVSPPEMSLDSFRAELDVFSGPLDLLLYLIKRNEVDILEISVAPITEQYLQVLRTMQMFDVNVAAEFLVMAATLMDIKSRSLLPETHLEGDEEPDARDDLVRQLLQYKRFKEVAARLSELGRERARRFAHIPPELPAEPAPAIDLEKLLENVTIWDLLSAYSKLIKQIEMKQPAHIVYDEVPVKLYIEEVLKLLREAGGQSQFLDFFRHDRSRGRVIGIFLALLELVRQGYVAVAQPEGTRSQFGVALTGRTAETPSLPNGEAAPEGSEI